MISLNVETLRNGNTRVTSRANGSTIKFVDCPVATREICVEVLRAAASGHEISLGVFDMTHIRLNDAARVAMGL